MGILALASGQALPGSGHPFCHQEEEIGTVSS